MQYETIESKKVKIDYLKFVVKFLMLIVGGMLTVSSVYFESSEHDFFLWLAVFLSVLAAAVALTVAEGIIRKMTPQPSWSLLAKLVRKIPNGTNTEYIRSTLSGALIACSWASFFIFVLLSR
ncbi:hypothetical protein [Halomonas sp. DWK9]|uniref:hypothetical protein n=1 Tax=Halomonas sp. DWK9 TaxID=3060155 RepID=UPI00287F603B|nr:hypothetical protein [Halomonas sp. DWK9]